jgi:hypothetical protein
MKIKLKPHDIAYTSSFYTTKQEDTYEDDDSCTKQLKYSLRHLIPKVSAIRINIFLVVILFVLMLRLIPSKSRLSQITETNMKGLFESDLVIANRQAVTLSSPANLSNLIKSTYLSISANNKTYAFQELKIQFESIKQTVLNIYENHNIAYKSCEKVPANLTGYLNSTQILQQANLTNLVEFYDEYIKNGTLKSDSQYVNKNINQSVNREFWSLWNSNNMSLLNVSNEYYGNDGANIRLGGYWKPSDCVSNFRIAIIIPYRDRLPHLRVLLYYLHMVLQRQMHEYRIFVVEPTTPLSVRFNKGRVMNAAFLEALKEDSQINCFIFHDVDLVPEDDRILYSCPPAPRHLSAAIDKFSYRLPYDYLVGGVFAIRTDQYRKVNGYSNTYWG